MPIRKQMAMASGMPLDLERFCIWSDQGFTLSAWASGEAKREILPRNFCERSAHEVYTRKAKLFRQH